MQCLISLSAVWKQSNSKRGIPDYWQKFPLNTHLQYPLLQIFPLFFYEVNVIAPRCLCKSKDQLSVNLQRIIADGGEGVFLRQPKSEYSHGRSLSLLKFKVRHCGIHEQIIVIIFIKASRGDKEALVVHASTDGSFDLQLYVPIDRFILFANIFCQGLMGLS